MRQANWNHRRIDAAAMQRIFREGEFRVWWVAEKAGVAKTTISRWLNGRTQYGEIPTIRRVASVLGADLDELTIPRGSNAG